jgi:hypothetical protein
VAPISELEHTLSSRSQSHPVSFAASYNSLSYAEPSDEMRRLIADLKAERDELRRDIDGRGTRVADLEKQSECTCAPCSHRVPRGVDRAQVPELAGG